jgi:hypothetical protein
MQSSEQWSLSEAETQSTWAGSNTTQLKSYQINTDTLFENYHLSHPDDT